MNILLLSRNAMVGLLVGLLLTVACQAQTSDFPPDITVKALCSRSALVPGQTVEVGILIEMAPGWHTYWKYAGDAGLATKVEWTLPDGFLAGPIEWPTPTASLEPGDIMTYGYSGEVLLIQKLQVPSDAKGNIHLSAKVSWLACKEMCVPGSATVSIDRPVETTASPTHADIFEKFRAQLPDRSPLPYPLRWVRHAKSLELTIENLPAGGKASLFPLPGPDQEVGHPKQISAASLQIEAQSPFRGLLVVESGSAKSSWYVTDHDSPTPQPERESSPQSPGLGLALFYGFLGGLILNLMPCVLPVISLKIFGFVRQANDSPHKILAHGLAFVAGIFVWFIGLALVVVALKSGGASVTWAFQFQNPWFNMAIGCLVFVFALNLFGVFEVVLPGRATSALDSAGSASGLAGSFFQGVFATLLATPCTAPYLGTALGFAFSQSALTILAMFLAIACGMGLPYLVLTARPGWMKFLPRPGAWMERLKQLMGFPLLATLIWILSILGGQLGRDAVVGYGWFLLCLALACWIYGCFCGPLSALRSRILALVAAGLLVVGSGWQFLSGSRSGIDWIPFSESSLSQARAGNQPVFVDFTADWCITCKFNERTAIQSASVRSLLQQKNVLCIKADWTNSDPAITAALARFGRVGVPFYVLYPPGPTSTPLVLPELLTEKTLADALKKLP